MGFRSTLISEDARGVTLPDWFIKKYKDYYNFSNTRDDKTKNRLLISTKYEIKFYNGKDEEIFIDIQKICIENNIQNFILILLHECGGITRVQIDKENIRFSEPCDWNEVEEVTHDYCYGCSDLPLLKK